LAKEVRVIKLEGTLLLDGKTFAVRLDSIHARMAVRAYAYSIASEEPAIAKALLERVGREG
jgi:hypothetical protein